MMKRTNSRIISFTCLLLLLGIFAFRQYSSCSQTNRNRSRIDLADTEKINSHKSTESYKRDIRIPPYVFRVLAYIRKYRKAPEGYEGGKEFKNREQKLQEWTESGRKIRYREWDLHPKMERRNRGRERLVTGYDEKAWYTDDHYNTFHEVKTTDE